MSWAYAVAYRLGVTPWERAGEAGGEQLDALFALVGQDGVGRALDLGCGRGQHAVRLARRGWQVTGVDQIQRALDSAGRRAAAAGVELTLVRGDVTALPAGVGSGYDFVLDIGCFHGLADDARERYGHEVTRVASPGAHLLLLAFSPGGRGPLPAGADAEQIRAALPGWRLAQTVAADVGEAPGTVRRRAPSFYRLIRQ